MSPISVGNPGRMWKPANGFDWHEEAACKSASPAERSYFFPPEPSSNEEPSPKAQWMADQARVYCNRCSVVGECRAFGMSLPQDSGGVYGGLAEWERRALRKSRKRAREQVRRAMGR